MKSVVYLKLFNKNKNQDKVVCNYINTYYVFMKMW